MEDNLKVVLTADQLCRRCWCFGHDDTRIYAPFLRFGDGGRLIGYRHANESGWMITEGRLAFLDEAGRPTTVFDHSTVGADGRIRLEGRHRDSSIIHFLREIDPEHGPAPYSPHITLIQRQPVGGRRNLVVLCANEHSLHTTWQRDIPERDRSWDLCIAYYGKPETFPPEDFSEYACLQYRQPKFLALGNLMHQGSVLWNYDYIMFPDDDLQMKWSDLNTVFAICHEYQLQLAQPSLDPSGVINYKASRQNAEFLLRFVTMVEIMAPIFSNQALRNCIHTFGYNKTGYGIDYAWSKLVDGPLTKIAVIDRVAINHTRPTGLNYDIYAAIKEGYAVVDQYGFFDHYMMRELGGILAHQSVDLDLISRDDLSANEKFEILSERALPLTAPRIDRVDEKSLGSDDPRTGLLALQGFQSSQDAPYEELALEKFEHARSKLNA